MVTLAGQLSIDDELEHVGLRRLGDGPELGVPLILPLVAKGWRLHDPVRAFAGGGFLFVLERDGVEVRRVGACLADVAVDLFREAARMTPVDGA